MHESSPSVLSRRTEFLVDVVTGLRSTPKMLLSKYFYDAEGSRLFDLICELEEYYLTSSEIELLQTHVRDMVRAIGPHVRLIELGSGNSLKTEILLDHLSTPASYVPVDISPSYLRSATRRLRLRYPDLKIVPVQADYTRELTLPPSTDKEARTIVFYPGSSIGNFDPREAVDLLRTIARVAGSDGGAIVGVDLKKDRSILEPAYNDERGVTAAFNLNILRRINRELGADFDLSEFRHRAIYNEDAGRIEMYLDSQAVQDVTLAGETFRLEKGEAVRTEYSYKYDLNDLEALARSAELVRARTWTDSRNWFAAHLLEPAARPETTRG